MKKLAALALAACMTVGFAFEASAIEVQVGGNMNFVLGLNKNTNFTDTESEDTIFARQRSRIAVKFIASENLRGVIQFQFGASEWGSREDGASIDTTNSSALTRHAYLDWSIPDANLKLKVGLQEISLPSAVAGNPVFGSNAAGIVASVDPAEPATITGFWARAYRSSVDTSTSASITHNNATDVFGLMAEIKLEKVTISPWGTVTLIGGLSMGDDDYNYATVFGYADDDAVMYNAGVAFSADVTPELTINLDAMYGKLTADKGIKNGGLREGDGWFAALGVNYKLGFGTPGIILWYASGNEDNDKDFGQMPALGVDGGFNPLRLSFMGAYTCGTDTLLGANAMGTTGIVLQIADMSFIENLSHTVRLGYIRGTNEKNIDRNYDPSLSNFNYGIALNEEDYVVEVDFDSLYKVNKNLNLVLELGYMRLKADKDYYNADLNDENAFNGQITARFHF